MKPYRSPALLAGKGTAPKLAPLHCAQTWVPLRPFPPTVLGELVNDYVIVRTRQPEFDYPKGEDNVSSTYAGTS